MPRFFDETVNYINFHAEKRSRQITIPNANGTDTARHFTADGYAVTADTATVKHKNPFGWSLEFFK